MHQGNSNLLQLCFINDNNEKISKTINILMFFYISQYYSFFYTAGETKILLLNLVTVVKWISTKEKTLLYNFVVWDCLWFFFVICICHFSLYVLLVIRSNLSSSPCLAQKFEFQSLPKVKLWLNRLCRLCENLLPYWNIHCIVETLSSFTFGMFCQ